MTLDHQQRLNLLAMLGMLECRTLAETRAAWMLMDRLSLNDQEKSAIEFNVQTVDGNDMYTWNPTKSLPQREYDLSQAELKQIERALNSCQRFLPGQSRRWLEPLLAQMPEPVEGNGAGR
jgi:hypothetical protein